MKNIAFRAGSVAEPVSKDYLKDVEGGVWLKFPDAYVDFLLQTNGGVPIQNTFNSNGNEKIVELFLPALENYKTHRLGCYDIEVVWSQIEDRLVEGAVPIASIFAGDFVCFDGRNDPASPSVAIWDHERSLLGAPHLTFVAKNFETFIGLLYVSDDLPP